MRKINWKQILVISYWLLVIGLLFYTRFLNLGWGLPFPFHPDERNMALAIQSLSCDSTGVESLIANLQYCFSPHFFAYGQLPLYVSYIGVQIYHFFTLAIGKPISFIEATMALRSISAIASVMTALTMFAIIRDMIRLHKDSTFSIPYTLFPILLIIFSPALIQFSHFGTTESLLMFFYTALLYISIVFMKGKMRIRYFVIASSLLLGFALGTKVSSAVYILIPLLAILFRKKKTRLLSIPVIMATIFFATGFIFLISSPQNFISFNEFISSISYESNIATGIARVFYTRQFDYAIPVLFQFKDIFMYALGIPVLILFLLGFVFLPWKRSDAALLRFAWIAYFVSQAFLYTKWTRFMAPIFPIMIMLAILFLIHVFSEVSAMKRFKKIIHHYHYVFSILFFLIICISIIPGIAYLSVYQNPDVRELASRWIIRHIPEGSNILSETANVVDLPLSISFPTPSYHIISFDFYDLDRDPLLQNELAVDVKKADYIIIPSRRIFANHTCMDNTNMNNTKYQIPNVKCQKLNEEYPLLNAYYLQLFNGNLGFKKIAEFSSYPTVSVFGKTLISFPDEGAEETWTVFDHPVIRIYQRMH